MSEGYENNPTITAPITRCQRNACRNNVEYLVVFDSAHDYWFCSTHAKHWNNTTTCTLVHARSSR